MHKALSYLGSLPDSTVVYNGHEYTKSNLAFGKSIEPESAGTKRLEELVANNKQTCGKSTIKDEKDWNVFMRLDSSEVLYVPTLVLYCLSAYDHCRRAIEADSSLAPEKVMETLRTKKNNF